MLIKTISGFSCTWWANACDSVGVRQTWVQAASVNDLSDFSLAKLPDIWSNLWCLTGEAKSKPGAKSHCTNGTGRLHLVFIIGAAVASVLIITWVPATTFSFDTPCRVTDTLYHSVSGPLSVHPSYVWFLMNIQPGFLSCSGGAFTDGCMCWSADLVAVAPGLCCLCKHIQSV